MTTSEVGKNLIKHFESLHDGDLSQIGLQPKMCPAGVWTEGWGHAMVHQGKQLKGIENKELAYSLASIKTVAQANEQLDKDLDHYEFVILKTVKVPIWQHHFDALVSLCFNIGEGNFKKSTLLSWLNDGNYVLASEKFLVWNKSNGRVLPGLVRRRIAEKLLFDEKIDLKKALEETERFAVARAMELIII